MSTARYRLSSNEVDKISTKNPAQTFSDRDTDFWDVLTNPNLPDGDETRDMSTDPIGPLRVFGFSKIAVPGTNTIRNATQIEIDTFALAELDDDNQQDADGATFLLQSHPQLRRILIAVVDITRQEINILRAEHGFSARTLTQVRNSILSRISKDD